MATRGGTCALYFDDSGGDDTKVYGNVFHKAGAALGTVFIAGGSDFSVTNNVFVDCPRPIYPQGFRPRVLPLFKQRLAAVNYNKPPWSEHYPGFANYLEGKHPRNNVIDNNLVTKSDDPRFVDGVHGNFALKPGADTGIPGFQPIPFDKIGR